VVKGPPTVLSGETGGHSHRRHDTAGGRASARRRPQDTRPMVRGEFPLEIGAV